MTALEITVAASELLQEITLPMYSDLKNEEAIKETEQNIASCLGKKELRLGGCILQRCLAVHPASEIWLASDEFKQAVVVKIIKHMVDVEIIETVSELRNKHLVPVLSYGSTSEFFYEVVPFYKNGSINGSKLDEKAIQEIVLPGLIDALQMLHGNQLIHNDIKPENIFWDDEKKNILLGDYDCVSRKGEKPQGYSLAYAAPEILLGNVAQFSTDWVSVGLTLGTLLQNEKIIRGTTKQEILKWWEGSFFYTKGSESFNQLINGMLQKDFRHRLGPKAAMAWINSNGFCGAENRTRHKRKKDVREMTLIFENPRFVVTDINEMLLAIEYYWNHFVFLYEQRRIEEFLRSINEEYYSYCRFLREEYDAEQSVFRLSYFFSEKQYFIWRGVKYEHLYELEQTWDKDEDAVKTFLVNGSVKFILKNEGASEEALTYVQELMDFGRLNAKKACNLLFVALRGEENFLWNGVTYTSIEELVEFVCRDRDLVDDVVEELLNNDRFQAWMSFQGYGDFSESILRRCR